MFRILIASVFLISSTLSPVFAGINRGNGSSFYDVTVYRGNGSTWDTVDTYRGNGSTWDQLNSTGATYPDVIFYWSADSTTADKSSGDTSATPDSSAAIDTVLYHDGTGSVDSPSAYSRYDFTLNNDDLIDVDSGRVGMWVYVTTSASNTTVFRAYYDTSNYLRLALWNTDRRIMMEYYSGGSGAQWESTSAGAFELDTWFFLEFAWNQGGAGNDFQVFINGVSVYTSDTASGTWAKSASGLLSIGDTEGNGADMHIDQIIISNDYTRDIYAIRAVTSF